MFFFYFLLIHHISDYYFIFSLFALMFFVISLHHSFFFLIIFLKVNSVANDLIPLFHIFIQEYSLIFICHHFLDDISKHIFIIIGFLTEIHP